MQHVGATSCNITGNMLRAVWPALLNMLHHDPTILHITCCICLTWTLCRSILSIIPLPPPPLPSSSPSSSPALPLPLLRPLPPLSLLHQPPTSSPSSPSARHLLSYSPSSPLAIPQFAASQIYLAPEVWFTVCIKGTMYITTSLVEYVPSCSIYWAHKTEHSQCGTCCA